MDKDYTLENYKFITGQLASLICILNALRGGIFPNATFDEFKYRMVKIESNGSNQFSFIKILYKLLYLSDVLSIRNHKTLKQL